MRPIDADNLKEDLNQKVLGDCRYREKIKSFAQWVIDGIIDNQPTIEPVKRGKWELDRNRGVVCCTNCGGEKPLKYLDNGTFHIQSFPSPYCPYCGAKMDGDNE